MLSLVSLYSLLLLQSFSASLFSALFYPLTWPQLRVPSVCRTIQSRVRVRSQTDGIEGFLLFSLWGNQSFLPLFQRYYTALISVPFCTVISWWLWDLEVSHWEIVICIFMFLLFGKSTGFLYVFQSTSVSRSVSLSFFPLFSFAGPPAHESLSNRLYFFIFIFLSVSPYRSRSSHSCLCRLNLLLPMPAECWSAPIYIQTMDGVESRFTSSLLSVTLLEPLISHSSSLSISAFQPVAPLPLLYCAFRMLGVFGNE